MTDVDGRKGSFGKEERSCETLHREHMGATRTWNSVIAGECHDLDEGCPFRETDRTHRQRARSIGDVSLH